MKTYVWLRRLNFCETWSEDQSTLKWIFEAAMGATDPDKVSLLRNMVTLYYCEIQTSLNVLDLLLSPSNSVSLTFC